MKPMDVIKVIDMKRGVPAFITGAATLLALGYAAVKAYRQCKEEDVNVIEGTCTEYDDMDNKDEFINNVNDIHNEDEVEDKEPDNEVIDET